MLSLFNSELMAQVDSSGPVVQHVVIRYSDVVCYSYSDDVDTLTVLLRGGHTVTLFTGKEEFISGHNAYMNVIERKEFYFKS